jgi:hypothetical protein
MKKPPRPRIYVVAMLDDDGIPFNEDRNVWTLSFNENELGWETDCGYPGYGLTKEVAQQIADVWNAPMSPPSRPDEMR